MKDWGKEAGLPECVRRYKTLKQLSIISDSYVGWLIGWFYLGGRLVWLYFKCKIIATYAIVKE